MSKFSPEEKTFIKGVEGSNSPRNLPTTLAKTHRLTKKRIEKLLKSFLSHGKKIEQTIKPTLS